MRRSRNPTVQFSLDRFHKYLGLDRCLQLIWWELGRLGVDVDDLPPYQREILEDLSSPIDEEAMADMLAYWEYDLPYLAERGRSWKKIPAKPRIDVEVEITSKGNLKAEWFPRGFNRWGAPPGEVDSDFLYWQRFESRGSGYYGRPSNELIFIHGVEHALITVRFNEREWAQPTRDLDHVLLHACGEVVGLLKDRLENHFDVRMLTDVFIEYTPEPDIKDRWDAPPPKIVDWELADPEQKQAEAEQAEIASMEDRIGVSAETLLAAWGKVEAEAAGVGNADLYARTAKRLREAGHDIKRPAVERAMRLIKRHEARTAKVISFNGQQAQ